MQVPPPGGKHGHKDSERWYANQVDSDPRDTTIHTSEHRTALIGSTHEASAFAESLLRQLISRRRGALIADGSTAHAYRSPGGDRSRPARHL